MDCIFGIIEKCPQRILQRRTPDASRIRPVLSPHRVHIRAFLGYDLDGHDDRKHFEQSGKNKEILNELKIYHTEKTVQIVSMDRITTINRMLEDKGSQVSFPEKPAMRIDTKNR